MNLLQTLKHYGIKSVWHFTDRSNLASIQKHGILSLALLEKHRIAVPCYGANALSHDLDRQRGLDKYIHLSIIKDHPMQYIKKKYGEIPNPIWLEIDISVLFENKSGCCSAVANASDSKCYGIEKLAEVIDLQTLLNHPPATHPVKKAELLVANRINFGKIKGVYHG